MQLMTMAWRNVWRNSRRSGVTIAAMTLSLLTMILFTSLYEGFLNKMERNIVEIEIGDIQVHTDDYRDKPSLYNRIDNPTALVKKLESQHYETTARLLGSGLVASAETSAGAVLYGINIEEDAEVNKVFQHIAKGEWITAEVSQGVVIGRLLAKTLNVEVGDELVLLSQAADGSMANDLFFVRGILRTISEGTDRAGVFMPAASFRTFFSLETDGAHQLIIRRPKDTELDTALDEVKAAARQGELEVMSWRQLMPTLASMLDSGLQMMQMAFLVVYVAVVILLLNAMLMAVFERVREFGVLKAIGFSPIGVMQLILIEGAIQTFIAVAIGIVLSLPALWYLVNTGIDLGQLGGVSMMGMSIDPVWRGLVSSTTFTAPLTTLLIVVLLGILYPAIKAARITPLEALHHQ